MTSRIWLVLVTANHFTAVAATQSTVGWHADALLEEVHRAIGEEDVCATGVAALESLGCGRVSAAQGRRCALPGTVTARVGSGERVRVPIDRNGRTRRGARRRPERIVRVVDRQYLANQDR